MRVIPVLDLMGGQVVRGIAGQRSEYRPVVSKLTASANPIDVAAAFRDHFGLRQFYLADLDAIAGQPPNLATYRALRDLGCQLWIDAGVRDNSDAWRLARDVEGIVAGLETLAGPEALDRLCGEFGERIIFSLDLKGGQPLGNAVAWQSCDPWSIAERAVTAGVRRMIVLDLARVGVGTGTGTEALCARLAATFPEVEVIAGGGVRNREDLGRLKGLGVRAVLVASALHNGRLSREDFADP